MSLVSPQNPTQSPVPSAPLPPAAPDLVPPGGIPAPHRFEVPNNGQGMAWLDRIGSQLSEQLISARSRRNQLGALYERSSGANRAGLEQQLKILDQRIAQLEVDIQQVGYQKTQIRPTSSTAAEPWTGLGSMVGGIPGGLTVLLAFFLLLPVSMGMTRWFWRRSKLNAQPAGGHDTTERLERMEQAIETIAIEVERVSEGQRYLSKIMTQGSSGATENGNATGHEALDGAKPLPALGAGMPETFVQQEDREEVRVRRS